MERRGRLPPQNHRLKKALTIPYLFPTFYAILLSLMNTEHLNPEQAKAVNTINGPVLIIAGALLSSCTSVYNCSTTIFSDEKTRCWLIPPPSVAVLTAARDYV